MSLSVIVPASNSASPKITTQEISGTMSEARRAKLLNIKKREDMKDVLVAKFRDRYKTGRAGTDANNEAAIAKEVGEFMDNAAVTEGNLKRLEKKIAQGSKFLEV